MVKECRAINGKVPGKKSGKLSVFITHSETGAYDLKIDADRGVFIAIDGDHYFEASTKDELTRFMSARARASRQITWKRYIVIKYEADGPGDFGNRRRLGQKDKIEPNVEGLIDDVGGVRLDWEIADYSDPITVPGQTCARIKVRHVFEARGSEERQVGHERWHFEGKLPPGAIPFSEEALTTLKRLRHGLGTIHLAINALLVGTPEEIAARLADPGSQRLLGSGPEGSNQDD